MNAYSDRVTGSFPEVSYLIRPEDPAGTYESDIDHQLAEVYAYGQFRLGEKWLAGLGLKPTYQSGDDALRLTRQASLRYNINDYHRLHFGGGTFNQFLSPGPEIQEWQWLEMNQLSLEYTYERRHWKVESAAYLKREKYEQRTDLNVRGAESRLTFQNDSWMAWSSLAVVRSRTVGAEVPTNRDLPFLARTQVQRTFGGNVTIGIAANWRRGTYFRPVIGRTALSGTEDWFAPILADQTAGQRYPNYQRIDFSASKIMAVGKASLVVYLNVNNLLDAKNIQAYSYDAAHLERTGELYSRRILFFGAVMSWQK